MRRDAKYPRPSGVSRRQALGMLTVPLACLPVNACKLRLLNPCKDASPPGSTATHEILERAFEGVDIARSIDSHVHLLGTGDSDGGAWVGTQMTSVYNPFQYVRYRFFLNAGCVQPDDPVDVAYVERLLACRRVFPDPFRLLLLAFDQVYDIDGRARPDISAFHVPNEYARTVAARFPQELVWAASIHPYREDAVEALDAAVAAKALAVKWLPNAMGIDPGAARCDRFYEAMARHRLPLITHSGEEHAVHGTDTQQYGNPLRLRRALDQGVRVVVAHCASQGEGVDLDAGPNGPVVPNFQLFSRLMDEPRHEHLLVGDVSALTQENRLDGGFLSTVLERTDWHTRLLNGSDYPLPGILPLFNLDRMAALGLLEETAVATLKQIQEHNPLLFDFVLKRTVSSRGAHFAPGVFETARHLGPPPAVQVQPYGN